MLTFNTSQSACARTKEIIKINCSRNGLSVSAGLLQLTGIGSFHFPEGQRALYLLSAAPPSRFVYIAVEF